MFSGIIARRKKALVVTELPPEMTISKFKETLDEFMQEKVISGFTEHHTES